MDAQTLVATYGTAGVTILILLAIIRAIWADLRETRAQMRTDQAAMLPALQAATSAVTNALEESIRSRAIAERERR